MTKRELKKLASQKAKQSICTYKVSAIGLNKRGEVIGSATNRFRFPEKRDKGNLHAEIALIHRYGKSLKTIVIGRVGNGGDLLPIHPCENCQAIADEMGIKIFSVWEW